MSETSLKVTLITHTPEPEKVVACAAKLCYSPSDITTLLDGLTSDKIESFVKMLTDLGHESPLEHISFTFGIEGVSKALTHQLVRHRIGCSYSQKSQRYVSENQFEYVIPEAIAKIPEAKELFIKAMENDQKVYDELVEILKEKHLIDLFDKNQIKPGQQGYEKAIKKLNQQAEKMAIEDARYVLPNACETKIIVTMNIRSLLHFFAERCCMRAQTEIRQMAIEMLRLVREIAPILFRKAGPKCVPISYCPEGAMCCGQFKEMKDKFLIK